LAIGGQSSTHPEALDVLCNVDVLTEGFDSESSYEIVLEEKDLWGGKSYPPEYVPLAVIGDWAPTKSMGKYIQRAVRNCRIHPKKTQAVYLDHSGNIRRHCYLVQHEGFSLDDGSAPVKARLVKSAAKYVMLECPRCHIGLPRAATRCPDCGCEQLAGAGSGSVKVVEEAPGELVEAKGEVVGVRKQLPHEQLTELRARMVEWVAGNERRVAEGKAPYKWGWVLKQYEQAFRQVADGKVVGRIRKEFGV
jgi:RNA polymerase subunit RPABC4/transcription elongation factor Spt4